MAEKDFCLDVKTRLQGDGESLTVTLTIAGIKDKGLAIAIGEVLSAVSRQVLPSVLAEYYSEPAAIIDKPRGPLN
jgi:hypothetical protein